MTADQPLRTSAGAQRRRRNNKLSCLATLLALAASSLWAGPLPHPKRLVDGYAVDLGPLFKWWTKHEGPRPLPAWVHITGSIVGTNAAGWILEAQVEKTALSRDEDPATRGPHRIVLRTPPVDDLVQFEYLSAKLSALTSQRAQLGTQEKEAHSREQNVAEQQRAARRNGARSRALALEDRQLKKTDSDLKAQEKPLDQQIQELKTRMAAYPSRDQFRIDCFALDLQRDYDQLPMYDYGQVMK